MSRSASPVFLMGVNLEGGNRGVQALASSLVHLVHRARPEAPITVFVGSRTAPTGPVEISGVPVRVLNFRSSPRARRDENLYWLFAASLLHALLPSRRLRRWILARHRPLAAMSEASLVGDIWGGDSFSDIYGLGKFLRGCLPSAMAILLGANLVMLPQTFGPFRSSLARKAAGWIAGRSGRLCARDLESEDVARSLVAGRRGGPPVVGSPDVAFALQPVEAEVGWIRPPLPAEDPSLLVGLNVSGLLYIGGFDRSNMFGLASHYPDVISGVAEGLLAQEGVRLLLVPHVFGASEENDVAACEDLHRRLSPAWEGRVHVVDRELSEREVKGLIGTCDFFLGSRMHACIGAISGRVPTLGLAYSRKFEGVFGRAGLEDLVLDLRNLDREALVARCVEGFARRTATAQRLEHTLPRIESELNQRFAEVLDPSAPPLSPPGRPGSSGR